MNKTNISNGKLSTQQIHQLGIDAVMTAAKNNNVRIMRSMQNPDQFMIDTKDGFKKLFVCCGYRDENKINTNISAKVDNEKYRNGMWMLVHINETTGKTRFFLISHQSLCMLQYRYDSALAKSDSYSVEKWMWGGKGRNNLDLDFLEKNGYELNWK